MVKLHIVLIFRFFYLLFLFTLIILFHICIFVKIHAFFLTFLSLFILNLLQIFKDYHILNHYPVQRTPFGIVNFELTGPILLFLIASTES